MVNKDLYTKYGELMIKAEIINNQINEIKKQIAEELKKQEEAVKGE
jgi:uncharacterized protein involved in exopolysaccharide biosynthesis